MGEILSKAACIDSGACIEYQDPNKTQPDNKTGEPNQQTNTGNQNKSFSLPKPILISKPGDHQSQLDNLALSKAISISTPVNKDDQAPISKPTQPVQVPDPQAIQAVLSVTSLYKLRSVTSLQTSASLESSQSVDLPKYTISEVSKHNSVDCGIWIIIGDDVFDITLFITNNLHPASSNFIVPYFGKDATEAYDLTFHSVEAGKMLAKYKIGSLKNQKNHKNNQISKTPHFNSFGRYKQKQMKVTKLFLYPIKGCNGIQVQSLELSNSGFINDRIYAFVNASTNKIINQLTHPVLSLIQVNDINDSGITINNKYIPFIKNKILDITWKSTTFKGYDQGNDVSSWITNYINKPNEKYIFVRIKKDNYRETSEYFALSFAPNNKQKISGFQNYQSVLMSSEESLNELNRRYKKKLLNKNKNGNINDDDEKEIHWDRFRMNIIIKGVPLPHFEDFMKHVTFGPKNNTQNAEILWSRRRYFCAVPQVNQKIGKALASQEPLTTAQRYRNAITLNDRTSLPGDKAVFFGSFYGIKKKGHIYVGQNVNSEHEELNFNKTRTNHGKSYFGLNSFNIGSQFGLDFYSQYQEFKLILKEQYNYNTIKLRFIISQHWAKAYHISLRESLKMGDHYLLKFIDNNNNIVIRAYTPLFDDNNNEMSFDLLIKVYSHGKMTQHLNNMKINDIILGKQNYGRICYYEINYIRFGDPRHTMFLSYNLNINRINLICGGSGITPIYQIITNINLNKDIDNTQLSVIYCNRTFDDILLKNELEIINKINNNIKIYFVLSSKDPIPINQNNIHNNNNNINIDIGTRITKNICKKYLFDPNIKVVSLLCGPHPMEESITKFLIQLGHDKKSISSF